MTTDGFLFAFLSILFISFVYGAYRIGIEIGKKRLVRSMTTLDRAMARSAPYIDVHASITRTRRQMEIYPSINMEMQVRGELLNQLWSGIPEQAIIFTQDLLTDPSIVEYQAKITVLLPKNH